MDTGNEPTNSSFNQATLAEAIIDGISAALDKSSDKQLKAMTESNVQIVAAIKDSNKVQQHELRRSTLFPTPGSQNGCGSIFTSKLQKQLMLLQEKGISIFVNSQEYKSSGSANDNAAIKLDHSTFFDFVVEKCEQKTYDDIRDRLSIPKKELSEESSRLFFTEKLLKMREPGYQTFLSSLCSDKKFQNIKIVDTHAGSEGFSIQSCQNGIFTWGSKPDLSSSALPMLLEAKAHDNDRPPTDKILQIDKEVILQGLDRLWAQLSFSGVLSKVVVFATTGVFNWCLLFTRSTGYCEPMVERLDIITISSLQLDSLWEDITTTAVEQGCQYYLTDDGSLVYQSLHKLTIPYLKCRIRYVAGINAKVYTVTLPNDKSEISAIEATWAIKVVRSTEEFRREAEALRDVKLEWDSTTTGRQFYALGASDYNNSSYGSWISQELRNDVASILQSFPNEMPSKKRKLRNKSTKKPWWITIGEAQEQYGGIIFMKVGEITLAEFLKVSNQDTTPIYDQIIESLNVMHRVNLCHCDIRNCNIMKFDNNWHLIDFDLSCVENAVINVYPDTEQFKSAPDAVQQHINGHKEPGDCGVIWTKDFDIEMARKCFLGRV
eukprot:gene11193-23381_t